MQLPDLRGPRHGRQHLEGVLAVDLAVANVELQQSPKHLEVLELACMRERGRVESGQCAVSHSKEWKIPQEKRTGPQLEEESSRRTFDVGELHVHARQLRAVLERLDVACGVAVARSGKHKLREGHETARERGRVESGQCALCQSKEWKIPQG